jgi:hypothetical protein
MCVGLPPQASHDHVEGRSNWRRSEVRDERDDLGLPEMLH